MAIRDQRYSPYDGPLRQRYAWAVIAWTGFRTYWRFWRTKLTFIAIWLVPLSFAMLVIAEYALLSQLGRISESGGPSVGSISLFLQTQIFSLALIFIANGCGIISDDLRHRTIQLYFSKPITKLDYALGKYLTLFLLGTLAVLIPAGILAAMRTLFFAQTEYLNEIIVMHAKAMVLATIVVAVICALVIGLSSLTHRTGYAVLAFIALLLIPIVIHVIAGVVSQGSPLSGLWSLPGLTNLAAQAFIGGPDSLHESVPPWSPFLVFAALFSAGIAALTWRISRLQGIA